MTGIKEAKAITLVPSGSPTVLNIGITGKQDIREDQIAFVHKKIEERINEILDENGTREFIGFTSLARGADTIFADVVKNKFHKPLQIVLPFSVDQYRQNFTNPEDLKTFDTWINEYANVKIIEKGNILDEKTKNTAYEETGRFLVDNCKEVIIVWDQSKPSGQGGTAEILGLIARRRPIKDINIIYIRPIDTNAFHDEINRQTKKVDKQASSLKRSYNFSWKSTILLGWLAAVCFAINAGFENIKLENTMTFVECLLVIAMVIVISISKIRKYHYRFILQRIKAEKLRLIEVFYHSNIRIEVHELANYNDDELSYLIQLTNNDIEKTAYVPRHYSHYCVKNLIEEQERYHRLVLKRKDLKRVHFYERAKQILIGVFLVHIVLSFISLVTIWLHTSPSFLYPHGFGVALCIILSAWKNSKHLLDYFKEEKAQLERDYDDIKPDQLLSKISSKMLTDNENWGSIFKGKTEEVRLF